MSPTSTRLPLKEIFTSATPLASALLIKPSLLASSTSSTNGALEAPGFFGSRLGTCVSTLALSLPSAVLLPAASTILAVTVMVVPLACGAKLVLTNPAALSAAVMVTLLVTPFEVIWTLSPTSTLLPLKLTLTSASPMASALLIQPSLFASSLISTTGATPALGAVVSTTTLSLPSALLFPATSTIFAVTFKVVPSGGTGTLVMTKPARLSAAVRTNSVITPLTSTRNLSPTLTLPPSNDTLMSTGPTDSVLPRRPSLLMSSMISTAGALPLFGTSVSMTNGTLALVALPAASVAVTLTTDGPLGSPFSGVTVHSPSGLTVVLTISPVASATRMLAPGSPVPLMVGVRSLVMPSPLTPLSEEGSSRAVRAGGVMSRNDETGETWSGE